MTKSPSSRDSPEGFVRDLDKRLARQERHSHHGVGAVGGGGGVHISADRNNASLLGYDSGIYTRQIVAKATPPTSADFGGHLRVGCVWVNTGVPAEECTPWADGFERADGPPGPDWVHTPLSDDNEDVSSLTTISGGVLVTALDTHPTTGVHDWATYYAAAERPATGGRYVEFQIARYHYQWSIYAYTQMNATDWSRQYLFVQINHVDTGFYSWDFGHLSADGTVETSIDDGTAPHLAVGATLTVRYETEDDGTCRVLINGTQVGEAVDAGAVTGQPYVGFSMNWRGAASPAPGLGSFEVGCLE